MKKKKTAPAEIRIDEMGCLGEYNAEDRVCSRFCALRLRCAVESSHYLRSEILEEFMYSETFSEKNQ